MLAQAPATAEPKPFPAAEPLPDDPGFYAGEAGMNPSERAGREIWYKATAGNARFHTYAFQQRVGVLIDWFRVLRRKRADRFAAWGLINDPGCCTPAREGCPAKSLEETYGFDWCPGDEELLKFVGREGYRDPACDFSDPAVDPNDLHSGTRSAPVRVRPRVRHVDRRARLSQVPEPALRRRSLAEPNGGLASWEG